KLTRRTRRVGSEATQNSVEISSPQQSYGRQLMGNSAAKTMDIIANSAGTRFLPLGFYFGAMRLRLSYCFPISWGTQDEFGITYYAGRRRTIGLCRCSSGRKKCPRDTLNGKRLMSSRFYRHRT